MPGDINCFFAPDGVRVRNYQLDADDCVKYLMGLLFSDVFLALPCVRCHAPIHKGAACNEMRHCGTCRCFVCGEIAPPGTDVLVDHWIGMGGCCPRFDAHCYWDVFAPNWKCREGECYDECRDCGREDHVYGIAEYHGHRKIRHFLTAIGSVHTSLQCKIVQGMLSWADDQAKVCVVTSFIDTARWINDAMHSMPFVT
ncbi:MAG: hypothetical protein CL902_00530 [Dehalococcoidia bacterium]|nr:hypothetical protein [Dehalococcoidia bacterium]|tara:strand:+ start:536 stop:1129 length:594 start_codon:yes stop_codon:yes gene_type:complete